MDENSRRMLDWAEQQGHENMRVRMQVTEALAKEAHVTLTLAMAALSGGVGYAVRLLGAGALQPAGWGLLVVTAWVAVVAGLLLGKCIMSRDLQIGANEPKNLYKPAYEVDDLRAAELEGLQRRIEHNTARNRAVACWLDRCRGMLVASQLVFIAAWAVAVAG